MTEIEKVWPSWQVEKLIGEGGFGKVYKAKKELFGDISWSAIKTVSIPNDCVVYISETTGYISTSEVIYTHNKTNGGTQSCGKKAASELTARFFTTG